MHMMVYYLPSWVTVNTLTLCWSPGVEQHTSRQLDTPNTACNVSLHTAFWENGPSILGQQSILHSRTCRELDWRLLSSTTQKLSWRCLSAVTLGFEFRMGWIWKKQTIVVKGIENSIILVYPIVILLFCIIPFLLPCFCDFQVTQSDTKQSQRVWYPLQRHDGLQIQTQKSNQRDIFYIYLYIIFRYSSIHVSKS